MIATAGSRHLMTDARYQPLPQVQPLHDLDRLYSWRRRTPQGWWNHTVNRLIDLSTLPAGWDGYGAEPVDNSALRLTSSLLKEASDLGLPEPVVVPTSRGGLQIEWHDDGVEVDLEIPPSGPAQLYVYMEHDDGRNPEFEGDVSAGVERLSEALDRIHASRALRDR